jgi:hypothetical protein
MPQGPVAMEFLYGLGLFIAALAVVGIIVWLLLSGAALILSWLGRLTGVDKRVDRFVQKQGDADLSPQDRVKQQTGNHPGAGGYG